MLEVTSAGATTALLVRSVMVMAMLCRRCCVQDRFANDWATELADGLGLRLSEEIAAMPCCRRRGERGEVLANLQQLALTTLSTTALEVDAGLAAPRAVASRCGAGLGFGAGWIQRTWCCGARCGAFRFREQRRWSGFTCGCMTRVGCIRGFRARCL